MTQPQDAVELAVKAAKFAAIDLVGLMAAHGLDFPTLNLILEPGWPEPVKHAFQEFVTCVDDVTKALAAKDGIQPGTKLSDKDREAYTQRAYAIVIDS